MCVGRAESIETFLWKISNEGERHLKHMSQAHGSNDRWQPQHGSKEIFNQPFECNLTLWLRSIKLHEFGYPNQSAMCVCVCMTIN